jgi:hypothetical protein
MWSVETVPNTVPMHDISHVAADMAASLDQRHVAARRAEHARDRCSGEARADDDMVGFDPHAGAACSPRQTPFNGGETPLVGILPKQCPIIVAVSRLCQPGGALLVMWTTGEV